MSAKDISRYLLQPAKRYSGVRMQQGRVLLDSDWNESERIDDEDARRTLIDVLCSKGTSNAGFLVDEVETAVEEVPVDGDDPEEPVTVEDVATYDFELAAGSFYLGGLRFEIDPAERFLEQSDWLQIDAAAADLPVAPTAAELPRYDLVYLRGWEQCVTATEDSEILEPALGGPDTRPRRSGRRRRGHSLQGS